MPLDSVSSRKKKGIILDVIGDSGPFSSVGKSIGYRIRVKGYHYLIDCGAPVFRLLGEDGIRTMRGIFGTHSHEDHRRWFTDIALYKFYNPAVKNKLHLITDETIHEEFEKNSKGALERSLSADSKRIVDLPYAQFVDQTRIGPARKFRIRFLKQRDYSMKWVVVDEEDRPAPPSKAKVFINPLANRPRLLFKDPESGLWIEPETYYSFDNPLFYNNDKRPFRDSDANLEVQAIKAIAWHGPPTIALSFVTPDQTLIVSSDTVYNPDLWTRMATERHVQNLGMSRKHFDESTIIHGNINDYTEMTWSQERLEKALSIYKEDHIILHDVAQKNSVVHTDYDQIRPLGRKAILTHSPDNFTAEQLLVRPEKSYHFFNNNVSELVSNNLFPLNADIYIKRFINTFVGFRDNAGPFKLYETPNGYLAYARQQEKVEGTILYRFQIFQDIRGGYYRMLEKPDSEEYIFSASGEILLLRNTAEGVEADKPHNFRPELTEAVLARDNNHEPASDHS